MELLQSALDSRKHLFLSTRTASNECIANQQISKSATTLHTRKPATEKRTQERYFVEQKSTLDQLMKICWKEAACLPGAEDVGTAASLGSSGTELEELEVEQALL